MSNIKMVAAIVIVFVSLLSIMSAYGTYSGLVTKSTEIDKLTGDINAQYQRRADVIPNMIKIANNSMNFQLKMYSEYAKAREGFEASQKAYETALKNAKTTEDLEKADIAWTDVQKQWNDVGLVINARTESVPEAQLNQLTELNNEIAGIENVIAGKREKYNTAIGEYNNMIKIPPSSWFASYWNFEAKKMFEAKKGAENAPVVPDFN